MGLGDEGAVRDVEVPASGGAFTVSPWAVEMADSAAALAASGDSSALISDTSKYSF